MELATKRLALREFHWDDLDAIYAYESDPAVTAYVCYGPLTRAECQAELTFHIAQQTTQPRLFYHLVITLRPHGPVIGWCGLKQSQNDPYQGELGYALHRDFWGVGYATEAARIMVAFGFDTLQFHRIIGTCHPNNQGSIRVLEKVGMHYEGCLRENKRCRGAWRSTNLYAVLQLPRTNGASFSSLA